MDPELEEWKHGGSFRSHARIRVQAIGLNNGTNLASDAADTMTTLHEKKRKEAPVRYYKEW